jgi:hypothetical protein
MTRPAEAKRRAEEAREKAQQAAAEAERRAEGAPDLLGGNRPGPGAAPL